MVCTCVNIHSRGIRVEIMHFFHSGNLALSRAIGDFEFKKNVSLSPEEQIITANPDVLEHTITEEDEFVVLACDGKLIRPQVEFSNIYHCIPRKVSGTASLHNKWWISSDIRYHSARSLLKSASSYATTVLRPIQHQVLALVAIT